MAVVTANGTLHSLADERQVGGGLCALVERRRVDGRTIVHGTCILQRMAQEPTPIDAGAEHRLVLADGRAVIVRILKQTMTACGPEIVRFEGPGHL